MEVTVKYKPYYLNPTKPQFHNRLYCARRIEILPHVYQRCYTNDISICAKDQDGKGSKGMLPRVSIWTAAVSIRNKWQNSATMQGSIMKWQRHIYQSKMALQNGQTGQFANEFMQSLPTRPFRKNSGLSWHALSYISRSAAPHGHSRKKYLRKRFTVKSPIFRTLLRLARRPWVMSRKGKHTNWIRAISNESSLDTVDLINIESGFLEQTRLKYLGMSVL